MKVKMKVLVTQSYQILCDPTDCGPLGPSIHVILQGSILEWEATPTSEDLPDPGIQHGYSSLWADSLPSETLIIPDDLE